MLPYHCIINHNQSSNISSVLRVLHSFIGKNLRKIYKKKSTTWIVEVWWWMAPDNAYMNTKMPYDSLFNRIEINS